MGSDIDPDARVATLPAPNDRWSRSAARWRSSADILVLDEPTAALPEADVERLLDTLRDARGRGIGIIYVTHRLDEVSASPTGSRCCATGARDRHARWPRRHPGELVRRRSSAARSPTRSSAGAADPIARARGRARRGSTASGRSSFAVAAGEILGLVGLRGAGHHTIGRASSAQCPIASGDISARRRRRSIPRDPAGADAARDRLRVQPARRGEHRRQHGGAREHLS